MSRKTILVALKKYLFGGRISYMVSIVPSYKQYLLKKQHLLSPSISGKVKITLHHTEQLKQHTGIDVAESPYIGQIILRRCAKYGKQAEFACK